MKTMICSVNKMMKLLTMYIRNVHNINFRGSSNDNTEKGEGGHKIYKSNVLFRKYKSVTVKYT